MRLIAARFRRMPSLLLLISGAIRARVDGACIGVARYLFSDLSAIISCQLIGFSLSVQFSFRPIYARFSRSARY